MDPFLHFLALQMSRTFVDSPEFVRRRETLRERDRDARSRRAHHRRREHLLQAVALVTACRWRRDRELARRTG